MAALLMTVGLRRRKERRRSLADETLTIWADERSRYACGGWNGEEEEWWREMNGNRRREVSRFAGMKWGSRERRTGCWLAHDHDGLARESQWNDQHEASTKAAKHVSIWGVLYYMLQINNLSIACSKGWMKNSTICSISHDTEHFQAKIITEGQLEMLLFYIYNSSTFNEHCSCDDLYPIQLAGAVDFVKPQIRTEMEVVGLSIAETHQNDHGVIQCYLDRSVSETICPTMPELYSRHGEGLSPKWLIRYLSNGLLEVSAVTWPRGSFS
jgi:hypothetical protein